MTPERIHYHALLLIAGDRTLLDQDMRSAQESEAPLDGLTLALLQCRDENETLHVLNEHLAAHPADMNQVSAMILSELKHQLDSGAITPEACLKKLHAISDPHARGGELFGLSCQTAYADELWEMSKAGIVSEAAFQTGLSALLAKSFPDGWDPPAPEPGAVPHAGKLRRLFARLRVLLKRK